MNLFQFFKKLSTVGYLKGGKIDRARILLKVSGKTIKIKKYSLLCYIDEWRTRHAFSWNIRIISYWWTFTSAKFSFASILSFASKLLCTAFQFLLHSHLSNPVSFSSVSQYNNILLPAVLFPCTGCHRFNFDAPSSWHCTQSPAILFLLTVPLDDTEGRVL